MLRQILFPAIAVASLGLAFSFNGCSCHEEFGSQEAKAPVTEPPPPPAPAPPPPAPVAAPAPRIMPVGKATIEGNRVKIPGELEFEVDKATIKHTPQTTEILTTLVEFMKQNPNVTKLRVEGHTDNTGTPEHNMKLSEERADAVAKWLGEHGVDKSRCVTKGYGQNKPVALNDNSDHKALNRRTEFHVQEIEGKTVEATEPPSAMAPSPAPTATGAVNTTNEPVNAVKKDAKALAKETKQAAHDVKNDVKKEEAKVEKKADEKRADDKKVEKKEIKKERAVEKK